MEIAIFRIQRYGLVAGLNSYHLLQTVAGDEKVNEECAKEEIKSKDADAAANRIAKSKSKNSLDVKTAIKSIGNMGDWNSSSDSPSPTEEVMFPLQNGSHHDLKG